MAKAISKEELKQPDSFVRFFEQLAKWSKINAKSIWFVVLGLAVVIGIVLMNQHKTKKLNADAANAFAAIVEAQPAQDAAPTEEDWQSYQDTISEFFTNYGDSSMAPMMKLHQAKAFLYQKKYQEAVQSYAEAQKQLIHPYNLLAREGQAVGYQFLTQYEKSLGVWKDLVALEDNPFKDYHLWNFGLNLEKLGKSEDAIAIYTQIEQEHQDSLYVTKAKTQKALIEK